MALQEIGETKVVIKRYFGDKPVLVVDPVTGKNHKFAGGAARVVSAPATQTVLVGTDAEVDAEKVKADAKYAAVEAAKVVEVAATK